MCVCLNFAWFEFGFGRWFNCSAAAKQRTCRRTYTPWHNRPTVRWCLLAATSHLCTSVVADRAKRTTSVAPFTTSVLPLDAPPRFLPVTHAWIKYRIMDRISANNSLLSFPKFAVEKLNSISLLLEAFGNCRTALNGNATRFTNIFSLDFDQSGQIASASIQV